MLDITQFQSEAMSAFRRKVVSWVGERIGPVMSDDISDIERKTMKVKDFKNPYGEKGVSNKIIEILE